ncbi:MAG: glycosyltransferase family 39 protein [Aggregatilineales bacterium]
MAVDVRTLWQRWRPVLALIALVMLLTLPVVTYPLGRDQGEFAVLGRGLLNGRVPYIDLWNPKPPAVFYVYAAAMALFGQTISALRLIDLLIAPPIALALAWLGMRWRGARVGLWAALLFAVFYFTETFWTLTQNDGIALLPMTLAVVCTVKAAEGGRRAAVWALCAGLLAGWVFWFKYPFVLFAAVLPLMAWLLSSPEARRRSPACAVAYAAGFSLMLVAGAGVMMRLGAWEALIESARVTSAYTARGFAPIEFSAAMSIALGYRWSHWGLLFLLAAAGLAISLRRCERAGYAALAWLNAGLLIMLAQAKGYDYHWLPMLPPLALFGAYAVDAGLAALAQRSSARFAERLVAGALLLALALSTWGRALPYLTGAQPVYDYYRGFQAGEFIAEESQQVADFLRARVVPGDSLFIWGFRPEVYFLSQLNPATRFIFHFPLVADWYPPEWREENVEILWAALPPYVLVLQVDYLPWVTGSDDDSNTLLQAYAGLNDWLIYNYEREGQIGNFFLWRRKS